MPKVKWNTDLIELNGKVHKLSITKDFILKEYSDIFKGVGTLPGGPYPITLEKDYKLVQHPPRSVPVAMQSAYRAQMDRLVKEGITEIKEHTEWINSIMPVMKSNGSLRLCLDSKDLNKATGRNQWYWRTGDDILPELAKSKLKTLKDVHNLRLLTHSLRLGKQSTHHLQHSLGQILMVETAIQTKDSQWCILRKTGQSA